MHQEKESLKNTISELKSSIELKNRNEKVMQSELEQVKSKQEIKMDSLKKEIEALSEQLNTQRKRNVDLDNIHENERKNIAEERQK